jgi:predicted DNA-binding ribbon-helix-helix protein
MMPVDMRHKLKIVAAHEDVSFVKLIIKILDGHLERNKNGN